MIYILFTIFMDILYCTNYSSRYYIQMCHIKQIQNCKKMTWVPVNENYFNNFIFAKFTKHMKTKNSYIEEWQWDQEQDLTPDLWVMARWDFQWLSLGYETERVEEDTSCCWFLIGCLWRRPGSDWFAVSGPWRLETWTRGAGFLCRPCPGLRQFYC